MDYSLVPSKGITPPNFVLKFLPMATKLSTIAKVFSLASRRAVNDSLISSLLKNQLGAKNVACFKLQLLLARRRLPVCDQNIGNKIAPTVVIVQRIYSLLASGSCGTGCGHARLASGMHHAKPNQERIRMGD